MERPGAVQVAMIGDGERVHAERLHPVQQFRDPVGAVEEGVLAMRVEMHERHGYAAESAVFCAVMQWLILALTLLVMAVLQRLPPRRFPPKRPPVGPRLPVFAPPPGGGPPRPPPLSPLPRGFP